MTYLLLGTSGCHLCELAEELIAECRVDKFNVNIDLIDIAEQSQWQDDFAIKIPVLLHPDSGRYIQWPFDRDDILNFVNHYYD